MSIFLFSAFTLLVGQEEKAVSIEMLDTSIVLSVKYQSGVCLSVCPVACTQTVLPGGSTANDAVSSCLGRSVQATNTSYRVVIEKPQFTWFCHFQQHIHPALL